MTGTFHQIEALYRQELTLALCGKLAYCSCIFPTQPSLIHPYETGLLVP